MLVMVYDFAFQLGQSLGQFFIGGQNLPHNRTKARMMAMLT